MSTNAPALGRPTVLADAIPGARTRDIALVVGGALFTALMAQLVIPMTPVPMTGQTLAIGLVGASLGLRRGLASIALYVALGFVFPFYAEGSSGISHLWGATGGYIWGFIAAAAIVGWMAEHGADRKISLAFATFVIAQLVIFVPGVVVLQLVTHLSWSAAIHSGFTVFIVGGLVKAAVGAAVLPGVWHAVNRSNG
ncbi:MAG: biotin transporter BioY [Solirubrobacteraceae bacterium]|nr:biotin transporter BioY [Patulibacter sp.]